MISIPKIVHVMLNQEVNYFVMCSHNLFIISLISQTSDKQWSTRTIRTDFRMKFQLTFNISLAIQVNYHKLLFNQK